MKHGFCEKPRDAFDPSMFIRVNLWLKNSWRSHM